MSEDIDLSENVDEVKKQIRDADDPDLKSLLEEEKDGKDRKTIKDFIQNRLDNEEVEVEESDEEEVVEEIEEETEGGLLGGLTREAVLSTGVAAGIVVGLVFGLAVGYYTMGLDAEISASDAGDKVNKFFDYRIESQPENLSEGQSSIDSVTIESVETRSGMYYVSTNLTQSVNTGNETTQRSRTVNFYVTQDGEYMFQERRQPLTGRTISPISLNQIIDRYENQTQTQDTAEGLNNSEE
jgi:hypothetical protein